MLLTEISPPTEPPGSASARPGQTSPCVPFRGYRRRPPRSSISSRRFPPSRGPREPAPHRGRAPLRAARTLPQPGPDRSASEAEAAAGWARAGVRGGWRRHWRGRPPGLGRTPLGRRHGSGSVRSWPTASMESEPSIKENEQEERGIEEERATWRSRKGASGLSRLHLEKCAWGTAKRPSRKKECHIVESKEKEKEKEKIAYIICYLHI